MSSAPRSPYAIALVLCDAVHRDPVTGKNTLLGTFSTITSRTFPAVHPEMSAYLALTDGAGTSRIDVRLTPADGAAAPLAEASFEVEFDDGRMTFEVVVGFADVVFPKAGEYRVSIACGEDVLLERRLMARSVGKGNADG
jgi:hypothetical protein